VADVIPPRGRGDQAGRCAGVARSVPVSEALSATEGQIEERAYDSFGVDADQ
jgi:hypothetical protein